MNRDCFAYEKPFKCFCLKEMMCYGNRPCPFYKTKEEVNMDEILSCVNEHGREKWLQALARNAGN